MPKRTKKPEAEPMTITPILRTDGVVVPPTGSPIADALNKQQPQHFEFAVCPICGSRQTTEVCPVDGHHFEAA